MKVCFINHALMGLRGFLCKSVAVLCLTLLAFGCQEDPLGFEPTGTMKKGDVVCCDGDKDLNQEFYKQINELKAAIAPLKNFENAKKAGWDIQATEYMPHMGYHYLNGALLDDKFELTKPELLLFIPGKNGKMKFVAVEYAVPIEDLNDIPPPPEGFIGDADTWVVNYGFSLWTLHVWIEVENPDGFFTPFNPNIP